MPSLTDQLKTKKITENSSAVVSKQKRDPQIHWIKDAENLVPTAQSDVNYKFDFFNPVQSGFFPYRTLNANFVICSATSSGKTVIAEMARVESGKFLYLSPLKAITEEKKDDWTNPEHDFSTLNISILTGDYSLSPEKVGELKEADIITLTSEMLDSRTRRMQSEKNDWLLDVSTLVIDEFHLIGYSGRGDKLESALIRFTSQNPDARLIALSATMPNVDVIANWLSALNGKDTYILQSNYRPVKLESEYVRYNDFGSYSDIEQRKIESAEQIVLSEPDDKFLVFVHSKVAGRKLQTYFQSKGIVCEFHNADLSLEDRKRIQAEFNKRTKSSLRVLIATSTLAWGVNTPADSVILVGLHRGLQLIDPMDVKQMIGRAGRVGLTNNPVGKAFILVPMKNEEEYIQFCENPTSVNSKFLDINVLCFHVCSEVLLGTVFDKKSLIEWYERSLAFEQGQYMRETDADQILNTLTELKMLKLNESTQRYEITNLGKVSAYMYYSPFDISDLYKNFTTIVMNDKPLNDLTFSWALTRIDTYSQLYTNKMLTDAIKFYRSQLYSRHMLNSNESYAQIGIAVYSLLTKTFEDNPYLAPLKRTIKFDMERLLQAVKLIDSMYARWNIQDKIDIFGIRIKYEAPEEYVPLLVIPQIGFSRADKLYKAGIKNADQLKANLKVASMLIGKNIVGTIVEKMGW